MVISPRRALEITEIIAGNFDRGVFRDCVVSIADLLSAVSSLRPSLSILEELPISAHHGASADVWVVYSSGNRSFTEELRKQVGPAEGEARSYPPILLADPTDWYVQV